MINILFLTVVGGIIGIAAGYIGSFMVLKRMSLVGDALSHVALPGMALALTWGISPMIGAMAALTLAVVGIWHLEKSSPVYPDALVGIIFTAGLALGILLTPEPELLEALFGNLDKITFIEGSAAVLFSLIIIRITFLIAKPLILSTVSVELTRVVEKKFSRYNLFYWLMVGAIVAVGVKFVGTLLMGALVIVPAAAAKNISRGILQYQLFSIAVALISSVAGVCLSAYLRLPVGPMVVLISVAVFIATFAFRRKNMATA